MIEITRLTRQIREVLAAEPGHAPVQSLAGLYQRHCQDAALRLDSCAAMLEKGSDYQALQLAETEPALLDLIAALSFEQSREWIQYCNDNQLPAPKKFDFKAIQALDQLYAKGITPNHPLYRDYRDAVLSRDDVKSLRIMRSILRMNPSDTNAKSELARLENKLFQVRLIELRKTLAENEEVLSISHLNELERLAPAERLAELPEYAKASEIRRRVARAEAMSTTEHLGNLLEEERRADAWRMVGDLLGRIRALQHEHQFSLTSELEAKCAELEAYYAARCSESYANARYEESVAAIRTFVDRVDSRILARSTLSRREAEGLHVEFHKLWTAMESFKRPVPEAFELRIHSCASSLRTEVSRLRTQRRMRLGAISCAALLAVGVVAWLAITAIRAGEFAEQLARLQDAGQVAAAEKMLADLRREKPEFAAHPKLATRIEQTDQWIRSEHENQERVQGLLGDLEHSLRTEVAQPNATVRVLAGVIPKIESATKLVESLAADQRPAADARLLIVRNLYESQVALIREQLVARTEADLSELTVTATSKLSYEKPVDELIAALQELEPRLKTLEQELQPTFSAVELPASHRIRAEELRKRFDLFASEVRKFEAIREGLAQAAGFEPYWEALSGFRQSQLRGEPSVVLARKLLGNIPQTDTLLAQLLMPEDPVGWAAIKTNIHGGGFLPETVMQPELDRLVGLRTDEFLNNVWELQFVDFKRERKTFPLYLKGDLAETSSDSGEVKDLKWTGKLYYPGPTTEVPSFKMQTVSLRQSTGGRTTGDGEIKSKKLSSSSDCLRFLELNRMTNETGAKFEKSLLRVMEVLVHEREANVVFKAYLFQQLAELIRLRPYAWGWQYAESLRKDVAELDNICGRAALRSSDWLVSLKNEQLGAKLTNFFKEAKSHHYFREAWLRREIIQGVMTSGLRFGGYLDSSGEARLLGEALNAKTLWVLSEDGRRLQRFKPAPPPTSGSEEGEKQPPPKAGPEARPAPFSPLVFVPIDRQDFFEKLDRKNPGLMGKPFVPPSIPWCQDP